MSLSRLSDEVVGRHAAGNARVVLETAGTNMPASVSTQPSAFQNALTVLTKYIPTEIITIYVPAIGVADALGYTTESVYLPFLALTPVTLFLIIQGQKKANAQPLLTLRTLPLWKLFASSLAFAVWALSLPRPPFLRGAAATVLAAFLAMAVSALLTLLEPFVEK